MVMGNATNCVGCGAPVVSCVLPAYCPACDPACNPLFRQALHKAPVPPMTEDLKLQLIKSIEEAQAGLQRYTILSGASAHTNPDEYQRLAARTECDQTRSVARMAGLLMRTTKGYTEPQLAMIRFNHGALGISKEGGELLALVEKWIYYGQELDKERVKDELGDVVWYAALVCNAVGLSLSEVMAANLRKLAVRYPDKYEDQKALVRDRAAEEVAVKSLDIQLPVKVPDVLHDVQRINEGMARRSMEWEKERAAEIERMILGDTAAEILAHKPTYSDPDFVPPPPCEHCRGAGQVNCEWGPHTFTTCPLCKGTGVG